MMDRMLKWNIALALCAALAISSVGLAAEGEGAMNVYGGDTQNIPVCGGRTEEQLPGYRDEIQSQEITAFRFDGASFHVSCVLQADGKLHVTSRGGDVYARNNSAFKLDYVTQDDGFLSALNDMILHHHMALHNGHTVYVAGLPEGYGDTLSVTYASGEKIFKSSNQTPTVSDAASQGIYNIFRSLAQRSGYDFTTDKSTTQLYDDADVAFLQGKWKGEHFGREVMAVFTGRHVQIWRDGELTDDTDYVIVNGRVKPDKLREKPLGDSPESAYEDFVGVTSIQKSNSFTLSVYVYRNKSSSNFNMLRVEDK